MSGPMLLQAPIPGDTSNVWGTALNVCLGLIENHDHTNGKGVQVPSAGIGINADLTFASFAGTNLKALAFTEVAASSMTSYADALFVDSTTHDLYFRNSSGVNVQLTEGNTINISIVGGIGGDYSTVGALVSYDDATHRYLFQQEGSPRPWAGVAMGNLDIYQQASGIGTFVRQQSPNSLVSSYTMTWLAALPASAMGLSIDNTGQIAAGASFAMQANANITLSGTGAYKHGTKTITKYLSKTSSSNVAAGTITDSTGVAGIQLANNTTVYFALPELPTECRILAVSVWFASAASATDCTMKLFYTDSADPPATTFTDLGVIGSGFGTAQLRIGSINATPSGSRTYHVQLANSATTPAVQAITVEYDVP